MLETPPSRAVLLVNSRSRRGREWFEQAEGELRAGGVHLESAERFRSISDLITKAKAAISNEVPMVIIGGGDGTFSAVIHLFVNSPTVLGVLPMGTGNAFARDLNIPPSIGAATRILLSGEVKRVDVGGIADDYFVNVATVGLTTKIAQSLTNDAKKKYGRFVYLFAISKSLGQISPFHAQLTLDGVEHEFDTLQVVIGNGQFHAGPFRLSPDAGIREGKLTLYALQTKSKVAFIKLGLRLASGTQRDLPDVFGAEFERGTLVTTPRKKVTVDGEVALRTPVEFSCIPRAVRVVVPAGILLK